MDNYFNALYDYLSIYKDALIQGQKDQQLAEEKRQMRINELASIDSKATEQIEECKTKIEWAESLIPVQKINKG